MAAVMLFLAATAYLVQSRQPDAAEFDDLPSGSPLLDETAGGGTATAGAATLRLWAASQRDSIARLHGGVVGDARGEAIKIIGQKIVSVLPTRHQNGFRFELLADETRAQSYAFQDGTIFVTLGLARLTEYESEVAAALCDGIERVVRWRAGAASLSPPNELSALWMQRAGFDPNDIEVVRQRMAARSTDPIGF